MPVTFASSLTTELRVTGLWESREVVHGLVPGWVTAQMGWGSEGQDTRRWQKGAIK